VHFQESDVSGNDVKNYYPSKILGFVTIDGVTEAVIHYSMTPLGWANVEQNFFANIKLGLCFDTSYVTVPLSALVHPLCVIPDYGGDNNMYIVVLPKCNWSRHFGNKIE
jgi:hypothetical protein